MEKSKHRRLTVDGVVYTITILERPFREGREVQFEVQGEMVTVSELGLGEKELELRVTEEIRKRVASAES